MIVKYHHFSILIFKKLLLHVQASSAQRLDIGPLLSRHLFFTKLCCLHTPKHRRILTRNGRFFTQLPTKNGRKREISLATTSVIDQQR